jgi:predicted phosphodiesterase
MRYAVLSDIHGNYEAFKSVLLYLENRSIDNFLFCGDIIGYGPQPVECIEEIRKLSNLKAVLGNHDAALIGKINIKWFNDAAVRSINYAKEKMDIDSINWINKLPERIDTEDFSIVHGSPRNPLKEYLLSEMQVYENLKYLNNKICFIGHSHMPMYFYLSEDNKVNGDFIKPMGKIVLNSSKCFINPGSVGQPRDGNPLASFGIYDSEKNTFENIRISYNISNVQDVMIKIGMPQILIDRLALGY